MEEFEEKQRNVEESLRHLRERAKESQQACAMPFVTSEGLLRNGCTADAVALYY